MKSASDKSNVLVISFYKDMADMSALTVETASQSSLGVDTIATTSSHNDKSKERSQFAEIWTKLTDFVKLRMI